jgi:hypothetical protein
LGGGDHRLAGTIALGDDALLNDWDGSDRDLDAEIASPRKVSVWYAFWGEASSRQEYQDICGKKDEEFAALVRELYVKAETTGSETAEGEDCYKLLLTPEEGKAVTMYFGKKSGLLKKTTVVATSQLGDIPAELIVSEYREFGGVLLPVKMTQKAAGQEFTITIGDVKVNQEIPPERFELPAEIKALPNR